MALLSKNNQNVEMIKDLDKIFLGNINRIEEPSIEGPNVAVKGDKIYLKIKNYYSTDVLSVDNGEFLRHNNIIRWKLDADENVLCNMYIETDKRKYCIHSVLVTNTNKSIIFNKNTMSNFTFNNNVELFDDGVKKYFKPIKESLINVQDTTIESSTGTVYLDNSLINCSKRTTFKTDSGELFNANISYQEGDIIKPSDDFYYDEGENFSFILSNGKLYAKGNNVYGQLGLGFECDNVSDYMFVSNNVSKISCGQTHSALIKNGTLWVTGNNIDNQIGINQINVFTDTKIEVNDVSCGNNYTLIIDLEGNIFSIGKGNSGQLFNNSLESHNTFINTNIKADKIIADNDKSFYLKDNVLYACGNKTSILPDSSNEEISLIEYNIKDCFGKNGLISILKNDDSLWITGENNDRINSESEIINYIKLKENVSFNYIGYNDMIIISDVVCFGPDFFESEYYLDKAYPSNIGIYKSGHVVFFDYKQKDSEIIKENFSIIKREISEIFKIKTEKLLNFKPGFSYIKSARIQSDPTYIGEQGKQSFNLFNIKLNQNAYNILNFIEDDKIYIKDECEVNPNELYFTNNEEILEVEYIGSNNNGVFCTFKTIPQDKTYAIIPLVSPQICDEELEIEKIIKYETYKDIFPLMKKIDVDIYETVIDLIPNKKYIINDNIPVYFTKISEGTYRSDIEFEYKIKYIKDYNINKISIEYKNTNISKSYFYASVDIPKNSYFEEFYMDIN